MMDKVKPYIILRQKELIRTIEVYKYTTDRVSYRAECDCLSVPGRTIKAAISNLLGDLNKLDED